MRAVVYLKSGAYFEVDAVTFQLTTSGWTTMPTGINYEAPDRNCDKLMYVDLSQIAAVVIKKEEA